MTIFSFSQNQMTFQPNWEMNHCVCSKEETKEINK